MVAGQNPNPDFPEISDDAGQVLYDYSKQFPGKKIWGDRKLIYCPITTFSKLKK